MKGHDRAQRILTHVVKKVSKIAVPGMGNWDDTWDITDPASKDLMDAIRVWEKSEDTEQDRDAVRVATNRYLAAWEEARIFYEEHKAGV